MGRHGRRSGAAVALTGIALAGGAAGAPPALAQPAQPAAAPPPPCLIGTVPFLAPPKADPKPDVATGVRRQCVDAATKDVLDVGDLLRYGLRAATAAATATTTTSPRPTPTTTPPRSTSPKTTTPAASPTSPRSKATTTRPTTTPPTKPWPVGAVPAAGADGQETVDPPAKDTSNDGTRGASDSGAAALPVAQAAPRAAAAPAGPAPGAPLAPSPGPSLGGAPVALGGAPLGAPLPFDQVIGSYDPASLLSPLGVPGEAAAPGEPALVENLGGDASGVTSSSRVESLGLDGVEGGGVAAALGVTIMSGLGGLALRHRILSRIRSSAAGAAPDPVGEHEA